MVIGIFLLLNFLSFDSYAEGNGGHKDPVIKPPEALARLKGAPPVKCRCTNMNPEKVRELNLQFLNYHRKRIGSDLVELKELLSAEGSLRTLRSWQIKAYTEQTKIKNEILARIGRYEKNLDKMPSVRLLVDDLATDFTEEDCGELVPIPHFSKNMFFSKVPVSNQTLNLGSVKFYMDETLEARCKSGKKEDGDLDSHIEADFCKECEEEQNGTLLSNARLITTMTDQASCKTEALICTSSSNVFLKILEVNKENLKSEKDLSNWYSEPQHQKNTSACAGFAVATDLEGEIHKMSLGGFELPKPDPWEVYGALNGTYSNCQGKDKSRSYRSGTSIGPGLVKLSLSGICADGIERRYQVKNSVALTNTSSVDFEFVKSMINSDKPFVAGITTERLRSYEDWSIPLEPYHSNEGHVVTVVGYGEGMAPTGFEVEPYVIVRDSLNEKPVHTKMRFEDFKAKLGGIWKIKDVSLSPQAH